MQSHGDQVRLLTPEGDYSLPGLTRHTYYSPGAILSGAGAPEYLKRRPVMGTFAGGVTSVGMLWRATSLVRPDEMFVAHWLIPSALAALAAGRRLCTPVHGYAHGSDIALLERRGGRPLARLIDRKVMGITFVSEDLRDRYIACLGRPSETCLTVIPMGITRAQPCEEYRRRIRSIAQGRRVISTIGRLVPIKGLDILLEALVDAEDYVWCAAGEGPELDTLVQRARERGVEFVPLGVVSAEEREGLLAESDLFVQPSRCLDGRREGSPLAVVEAVAAGVPTIATATGGLVALAEKSGAVLVQPDDVEDLASAVKTLLGDDEICLNLREAHTRYGVRQTWDEIGKEHWAAVQASAARFRCATP